MTATHWIAFRRCLAAGLGTLVLTMHAHAAVVHPMDPLTADEILGAAFMLQGAGAAQPGAIFQSIDLREPSKEAVLAAGTHLPTQVA